MDINPPPNTDQSSLVSKLESILFVAGKPLTIRRLVEVTQAEESAVGAVLDELAGRWSGASGLRLVRHGQEVELVTAPVHTELVRHFLKREELGELTRPQLEALTIIAYRGPLSKAELEQIRGVNCSLILRNLQIRGLVEEREEAPVPTFQVTVDCLRSLGLTNLGQLPDYQRLHAPETLQQLLGQSAVPSININQGGSTPADESDSVDSQVVQTSATD